MGYVYLIIALVLNSIANFLMKIGSGNLNYFTEYGIVQGVMKNYVLILGGLLFAINLIFYVMALSKINLSIAYPIASSGGVVLISILSYLFLKETISPIQLFGYALIIGGIFCVTFRSF